MFGRLRERWSLKACTELSNTYSEHQNYDILATKLSIYERAHSHTGTQAHTHAHRAHAHKRKHTHTLSSFACDHLNRILPYHSSMNTRNILAQQRQNL